MISIVVCPPPDNLFHSDSIQSPICLVDCHRHSQIQLTLHPMVVAVVMATDDYVMSSLVMSVESGVCQVCD